MGFSEDLPDAVYTEIFQLLPASQIAGSCSLVCRSWRDMTSDSPLWRDLCLAAGLSHTDGLRCPLGWKGLFGQVFGQNMVASPHFEPVLHMDMEAMKHQTLSPWEPKHRLLLNRIPTLDENHDDSHTYSFWAVEGGSIFQRGGGDGVVRECPPVRCPPCPASPANTPVVATSYDWGKVQQSISFPTFSKKFLDTSPPIFVSAWHVGCPGTDSKVKLQVLLRDDLKNNIFFWDSGEILTKPGEWQEIKAIIRGYPSGLRSIILKIGGMSIGIKKKNGFSGAKFTGLKLKFVPSFEVKHYDKEMTEFGKTTVYTP